MNTKIENPIKDEKGFTLVELLVAVAIVGILVSTALPMLSSYKKRAFNARAVSDLRSLMSGQEAYFVDNETYFSSCENAECEVLSGFKLSKNVQIITASVDDGANFFIRSKHKIGDICYSVFSYQDNPDGAIRGAITKTKGDCPSP